MEKIVGNAKMFCLINTTNYNGDGNYQVIVCNLEELFDLGFDRESDKKWLEELNVDEIALTDYVGCHIMRIA
jgi:hypothetical protein